MILEDVEGATPLEHEEMEGLKFKHITTRGQLDELESQNILMGLKWLSKKRSADIQSDSFLREFHKQLFGVVWAWAGTYRLTEKNIGDDPSYISTNLINLLEDCKAWVEYESYPPIEIAVRLHHRLVKIHPFPNGNGRTSRMYADLIASKLLGIGPIDYTSGGDLSNESPERSKYINALRQADGGDYSGLLDIAHNSI